MGRTIFEHYSLFFHSSILFSAPTSSSSAPPLPHLSLAYIYTSPNRWRKHILPHYLRLTLLTLVSYRRDPFLKVVVPGARGGGFNR